MICCVCVLGFLTISKEHQLHSRLSLRSMADLSPPTHPAIPPALERSLEFRRRLGRSVLGRPRDMLLLVRVDKMPKEDDRRRPKCGRDDVELRLRSRCSASSRRAVAFPMIGASGGGSVLWPMLKLRLLDLDLALCFECDTLAQSSRSLSRISPISSGSISANGDRSDEGDSGGLKERGVIRGLGRMSIPHVELATHR